MIKVLICAAKLLLFRQICKSIQLLPTLYRIFGFLRLLNSLHKYTRKNVRLVSFNLGLEDSGLPFKTKYLQNKTHAAREQKPCSWF